MHADESPSGTTPPPSLLPGLGLGPAMEQHLRQSLTVLRDNAGDPGVRERIDAVLGGRLSLRELAVDPDFGSMMEPLVHAGLQKLDEMSPEEESRARAGAEALERGEDPAAAMGLSPDEPVTDAPAPHSPHSPPNSPHSAPDPPPATHGTW